MSRRDEDLDLEDLAGEAREWVGRIASGEAGSEDAAAMMEWRARSSAHAVALGEAVRLRRRVIAAGEALRADSSGRWLASQPSRAPVSRLGRRAFMGGAVAASAAAVAGVLVVRPPMELWPSLAELGADYRTAAGEQRTIALAPGTWVELNTRTSIALRRDSHAHRMRLIAGEVAVDSRDAALPTVVSTDAGLAVARAGRFGVRVQDRSACVTCFAGELTVRDVRRRGLVLRQGQQVVIGGRDEPKPIPVDVARAEAWRRGELIFTDQPLSDVVEEINRYRRGRIVLTNAALGRIPVNAVFRLDRIGNAVAQIREVSNASVTSLPGGVVLVS